MYVPSWRPMEVGRHGTKRLHFGALDNHILTAYSAYSAVPSPSSRPRPLPRSLTLHAFSLACSGVPGHNPLRKLPRINLRRMSSSPRRVVRMGRSSDECNWCRSWRTEEKPDKRREKWVTVSIPTQLAEMLNQLAFVEDVRSMSQIHAVREVRAQIPTCLWEEYQLLVGGLRDPSDSYLFSCLLQAFLKSTLRNRWPSSTAKPSRRS